MREMLIVSLSAATSRVQQVAGGGRFANVAHGWTTTGCLPCPRAHAPLSNRYKATASHVQNPEGIEVARAGSSTFRSADVGVIPDQMITEEILARSDVRT